MKKTLTLLTTIALTCFISFNLGSGLVPNAWSLELKAGSILPAFEVKNQKNETINLESIKGKVVLFYFYPKDQTPGCTKQACSLRDHFKAFKDKGVTIYGVSKQDQKSHQAFKAEHRLPFDLIADPVGQLGRLFGVGTLPLLGWYSRDSILVGKDGKIIQIYRNVNPTEHAEMILKQIP